MKDVLFVVDEKQMGGVSVLLEDILKKIDFSKYNIDVLVLHNNGDYLDNLPKEVNVIYGSSFFTTVDLSIKEVLKSKNIVNIFKKTYLVFLLLTGLIVRKIKKERHKCLTKHYDVEIAFKDGFCALFTAYGDGDKKYHWLHTDYEMYDCTSKYHSLYTKTFPLFDSIIAISHSVAKNFNKKYPDIECEVIYNLIDVQKIKKMGNLEKIEFADNLNLISVGRFHNMKGYDRLIKVFNRLNKKGNLKNVKLRLIGDGPDFQLVKRMIEDYKLEDKIELLGRMKNPFPYEQASDAFLMCSRYEPFGLVILEAMILGVPVISTSVASIDEIMDKRYGVITENSEEGLYKAILEIIENPKMLNVYRENLRQFVYDTSEIIKQIEELIDRN